MNTLAHRLAVACCLFAGLSGCIGPSDQPELGEVSGIVTLDGQPLQGVIVMFAPDSGRPATGVTGPDGRYELVYRYGVNGAKVGPNTVSFEYPTGELGPPIPEEYGGRSTVKKEVEPGENKIDFALESKGNRAGGSQSPSKSVGRGIAD